MFRPCVALNGGGIRVDLGFCQGVGLRILRAYGLSAVAEELAVDAFVARSGDDLMTEVG